MPVTQALGLLVAAAVRVGLVLEPSKSEVIVPSPTSSANLRGLPAGFVRRSGEFELLGAAFGAAAYCNQHAMRERVDRASELLHALAELPDAQTAMLLLRYCGSHAKLVHASRVTPPCLHEPALLEFDARVRACLEQVGALTLTPQAWRQACLKVRLGGLGLRSAARHAAAAYISSVSACVAACAQLDPSFRPDLSLPVAQYNAMVAASDHVPAPPALVRQQQLSDALDSAELTALHSTAEGEAARAHLRLLQQPGAGAWLQAPPAEAFGLTLAPHFYRVLLRMRLRLPVASTEGHCPMCDGIADKFGDHARCCTCGGDRGKRHSRLRTVLAERAAAAGLSPEVEKAGLLPARPPEHGSCEAGDQALSVALQRENARAVLRRLPDAEGAERLLLD